MSARQGRRRDPFLPFLAVSFVSMVDAFVLLPVTPASTGSLHTARHQIASQRFRGQPVVLEQRTEARHGTSRTSPISISMANVRGVATENDLMAVVALASNPLPNRPEGTVVVVQYSSANDYTCATVDQEFDRLSIQHTDCLFLRCYKEFEGAPLTMSTRGISNLPTFEVFYKGVPVAKVDGSRISEVQDYIKQFGFVVSKTDLFSTDSPYQQDASRPAGRTGEGSNPWDSAADQAAAASKRESSGGAMKAPRTTQRYFPGMMMGTEAAKNVEGGSMMDEFQQERRRPKPGGGASISGDTGAGVAPFGMGDAKGGGGEKEGGPGPRSPERDAAEDALNRMWEDYN